MNNKRRNGINLTKVAIYSASAIAAAISLFWIFMPRLSCGPLPAVPVICRTNLKELGKIMQAYADDHFGKVPSAAKWCDVVSPYILAEKRNPSGCLKCPEVKSDTRICTYAMNDKISDMNTADINPNTVLLFETSAGWNQHGGSELIQCRKHKTRSMACNILYVDGHVDFLWEKDVPKLRWKP